MEGNINDFIFLELPKVILPFKKGEKTIKVTGHRTKTGTFVKPHERKIKEGEKKTIYEPTETWEEFVIKNKSLIDIEINKIRKFGENIKTEKNKNKFFNNEIRDLNNKLTDIWSKNKIIKEGDNKKLVN